MKVTRTYEVTGCHNCPDCQLVCKLGQGGFDDGMIYVCPKGAYGSYDDIWKWQGGYRTAPDYFPVGCPYKEELTGEETIEELFKKYDIKTINKFIKKYAKGLEENDANCNT